MQILYGEFDYFRGHEVLFVEEGRDHLLHVAVDEDGGRLVGHRLLLPRLRQAPDYSKPGKYIIKIIRKRLKEKEKDRTSIHRNASRPR